MRGYLQRLCCTAVILFSLLASGHTLAAEEEPKSSMAEDSKSAILMEMDTGEVLFEKNSDEELPPASMTKIMTMLLIMEAIEEEKLDWEDKVTTSEHAASMGGSQVFLEPGEEMTVRDMLKAIAIASGNDASVAMAEHIGGSEEEFVNMMNEKAEELGLKHTHFSNANGLPADNHYSTAEDLAKMGRELLKHEEITSFTGIYDDYLRQGTEDEFWLVNTNRLVKFYDGVDGLKTGFTNEAKYGLTATAKRSDMRVIAVVMGAESPSDRNQQVAELLDYAFAKYEVHPLYEKGHTVQNVPVRKGSESSVQGVLDHRFSLLVPKGTDIENTEEEVEMKDSLHAPVEKGEEIGTLTVKIEDKVIASAKIIAGDDVKEASWWRLFLDSIGSLAGLSKE